MANDDDADDDNHVISPAISRNASAKSRSEVAIAQGQEPSETEPNTEAVDENDVEEHKGSDQIVDIDPVEQEALEDEILNDEKQEEADNNDQLEKVGLNTPLYSKNV